MLGTPLNGIRDLTLPSLQEKQQVIKTDIVIKGKKTEMFFCKLPLNEGSN